MRTKILLIAVATLALVFAGTTPGRAEPVPATYQVTITNLTSEGQPLTPPLIATHRPPVSLFDVGSPASSELQQVAENGNLDPMLEHLMGNKHVSDFVVAAGTPPPLMPQQSITAEITAEKGAKWLSFASMLICTNDGFTGVNTLRLPKKVGDTVTVEADAYDAGTEINTEDFADIVPPCPLLTNVESDDPGTDMSDPALAENGVIHHHAGIQGGTDLVPETHDWENPVVVVEITRVE